MRYVLLLLVVLIAAGVGGFVWLGWYRTIPPAAPAPGAYPAASVARGATLAAIGNCMSCHTARDGAPLAGGRPLETPFGTIYASNITPDPATGIGTWSEAAFRRAMHEGVDRTGHQLYPAFPYDHFTKVSGADDADLYAWLMTRPPVHAAVPANDLSFPFNIRFLVTGWKLLFFRPTPFAPAPDQSAAWNRGAYLVQGLAHCGACHTPHNFLGAEETAHPLAGGVAQGWYAYPLDDASPAPTPWTADTLFDYLRHGWTPRHGDALGPMAEVTHNLAAVPDDDLHAIATYVAAGIHPAHPAPPVVSPAGPGEALYRGACASCHENSAGPPFAGIDLRLSSATHATNPANLANMIATGIPASGEQPAPIMPGFGDVLDNRQIADLVFWLRGRFGVANPQQGVADAVQTARGAAAQREASR